jgi:hypothetical protein
MELQIFMNINIRRLILPPAAKTLFEKRVLDSQKLLINKKLLQMLHGSRGTGGWQPRPIKGGF